MPHRHAHDDERRHTPAPDLPLFASTPPDVVGMARAQDRPTSIEAAETALESAPNLRQRVLEAFRVHGPMTDEELETLPAFARFGPTTIRKRRCELAEGVAPYVATTGERRKNSRGVWMFVWRATSRGISENVE